MTLSRYICTLVFFIFASSVSAQDAKELSELRADMVVLTQRITDANTDLKKYEGKITELEQDITLAESELTDARDDEQDAIAVYEQDPVPANKRSLDRAKSTALLAERKLASLKSRLEFSEGKFNEARGVIASNRNAVERNKTRQDELAEEIAVREQAQQLAEKRSAELAKQKRDEQKAQIAKTVEIAAPKVEKAVPVTPKVEVEKRAADPAAKEIVAEFNEYLASGVRERGELRRPVGYSSVNGKFSLDHLGGELYQGEVALDAGEHRFSIGANVYRVQVEGPDAGKLHIVYFDNRDRYKKKLSVFEKSLIQ